MRASDHTPNDQIRAVQSQLSYWELTGSEFWVGFVAFTQFAPAVLFGPLFGVLADRVDRRKASIVINSLSALNMVLLGVLVWFGLVDIYVLTTQSLVQGALDGAHTPVRMTLVPNLVEKAQLQSAIASASISFNVSRFVGPAIAGFIIATAGVSTAFAINGISYLAIIAAVAVIELRPTTPRSKQPGDVWAELLDGVRYAMTHKTIRGLLITVAIASIFGRGALEMMPAFADAIYDRGAAGLATLTAAIGIGAIMLGSGAAGGRDGCYFIVVRRRLTDTDPDPGRRGSARQSQQLVGNDRLWWHRVW